LRLSLSFPSGRKNIFLITKYTINLRNFLFKYCSRGRNVVHKGIAQRTSSLTSRS
jgi:hypothetical protein